MRRSVSQSPVVSPDGTHIVFGLKVEGEGNGILLMALTAGPNPTTASDS